MSRYGKAPMINETYTKMLGEKSVIRQIAERASARRREVGADHVYDFSLGNPNVPVSPQFTRAMIDLYGHADSQTLHGYSPSTGNERFRERIAQSLNRRFGMDYAPHHIFPVAGATAALAHALRAVTVPGMEVIVFAPFFPEYRPYIEACGAKLTVLPSDPVTFQIDADALGRAVTANTAAVLINTPNNPSGAVYSESTLRALAEVLERKQHEFRHDIFLISDEPYREIVFDGSSQPYPSRFYRNTLSCYSFSKSLSIPGERIGYVAIHPHATDAGILSAVFAQISRTTGHNCPSSSMQLAIAEIPDATSELGVYETNMNLLYDALVDMGFTVARPGGTFYIFPATLEPDAVAFCRKAMDYDLYLVPSNSFGVQGHMRLSYCLETAQVEAGIGRLREFVRDNY